MNHSCDPNSAVKGDNKLIAIRDIEKGEEITYDYSATVGTNITSWTMKCKCGSVNCRGTLGNVTTVPKEQLEKYLAAGGVQKFIRKQLKESKIITNKSNNFYKITSIVLLIVGILSFLAGLLCEYSPEFFRDDAMFFPAYFYQLGYGVLAILFYFYSFIAKHIITKIIWWIYFVILVIGFYVLMISDPFSLQKLAGQALMPKDTATESASDTKYENGVVRTKSGEYIVEEQPMETAAEPVTPVEF